MKFLRDKSYEQIQCYRSFLVFDFPTSIDALRALVDVTRFKLMPNRYNSEVFTIKTVEHHKY